MVEGNGVETDGAFVELDKAKLSKEQIYMLGCKETLDLCVDEIRRKAFENAQFADLSTILSQVADWLAQRRDECAVDLTRSAVQSGSATMHNAHGKKIN